MPPLPELAEASKLIRNAGGVLVFAHPNDPNGTSLVSATRDLDEQMKIYVAEQFRFSTPIKTCYLRQKGSF